MTVICKKNKYIICYLFYKLLTHSIEHGIFQVNAAKLDFFYIDIFFYQPVLCFFVCDHHFGTLSLRRLSVSDRFAHCNFIFNGFPHFEHSLTISSYLQHFLCGIEAFHAFLCLLSKVLSKLILDCSPYDLH